MSDARVDSSPFLEDAVAYAEAGFAVFPCKPHGKTPIVKHGVKDATRDEAQIRAWWSKWPDANIGIATGSPSGIMVVDIDGVNGWALLDELAAQNEIPSSSTVRTARGAHIYFALPEGVGRVKSTAKDGFDIRGDGGYVLAPPSLHPDGPTYSWVEDSPSVFAEAPPWLLRFANNRQLPSANAEILAESRRKPVETSLGLAAINSNVEAAGVTTPGVRLPPLPASAGDLHSAVPWSELEEARLRSALNVVPAEERGVWLQVGMALHSLVKDDSRWAAPGRARSLWDEWSGTCPGKFSEEGQDKTWESFDREYDGPRITVATIYHFAREAGWIDPSGPPVNAGDETPLVTPKQGIDFSRYMRTDAGNALMFLDMFGENLRFIEKWGCWFVWDRTRWRDASDIVLLPLARRTTEEMLRWAIAQAAGNLDRDAWLKHALSTQKGARLREMITLAKGEAHVRLEPDMLDADSWLLGCTNGTLDLRTGKLREARREDFITKQIGAQFDIEAHCLNWLNFINWATRGDNELAEFLQRFAGYAQTGEIREEIMCALVGDGANGKSTFLMTLFELMGDYAAKARSDLLVHAQGKEGAPSPDVAALHGKRLVIVSETEDGCSLSEARIKDIVSNEIVAARRLHRDPFTFRPTHKTILSTNYRPHVRGTDEGIWRRLAIVRFDAAIKEGRKVADFREKFLRPELPGILNWVVEGLVRWRRDGLGLPASVRAATAEYRSEMDTVAQWIEERTEKDPGTIAPVNVLHSDYVNYLAPHGHPFGPRRFGEELERKGYAACKLAGGARARRGLKLKPLGAMTHLKVVR